MTRAAAVAVVTVVGMCLSPAALAQDSKGGQGRGRQAVDPQAIERLQADTGGNALVSIHPATGTARFVRSGRARAAS